MSVFPKRPGASNLDTATAAPSVMMAKSYQFGLPWSFRRIYGIPGSFSFTVPVGVTKLRAIAIGAGGAGGCCDQNSYYAGAGAGGGYAEKVYDVTAGQIASIVVGAGGVTYAANGGTSSVTVNGIAISATGGGGGATNANAPGGVGTGGDINFSGGIGARVSVSTAQRGGGAAGSPLGNGGYCDNTNIPANSLGGAGIGGSINKSMCGAGSHGPGSLSPVAISRGGPGLISSGALSGFTSTYYLRPAENGTGGNWWDLHDIEGSGGGCYGIIGNSAGGFGGPGAGGGIGDSGAPGGNGGFLGGGAGSTQIAANKAGDGGPGGGGGSAYVPGNFGFGGNGVVILYW